MRDVVVVVVVDDISLLSQKKKKIMALAMAGRDVAPLLLLLLLAVLVSCVASAAPPQQPGTSAPDCRALGFLPGLECTTCSRLLETTGDLPLVQECRACCRGEPESEAELFDGATIEVDPHALDNKGFPELEAWIKDHLKDWASQVKVKRVSWVSPVLILHQKGNSKKRESALIHTWDRASIQDFLKAKLKKIEN